MLVIKRAIASFIVIGTLFFLGSCSFDDKIPIRLGVNIWPGYEYLFLADTLGYYEDEGLVIQLVETNSLDDLRRAFERGKIDGMASTIVEVVQAAANSERLPKIFMVPDFSNGADVIVAANSINSIKELKGKKVGMALSSLGEYLVARALEKNGLSMADIIPVPMHQESMFKGMELGHVDAVMTYPPTSIKLANELNANTIFSSADIPDEIIDVVTLDASVIESRPDVPIKILRAWSRALEYAEKKPAEAHKMSAFHQGISVEEFKGLLSGIQLLSIKEQRRFLVEDHESLTNVIHKVSSITVKKRDQKILPTAHDFIYSDAINAL